MNPEFRLMKPELRDDVIELMDDGMSFREAFDTVKSGNYKFNHMRKMANDADYRLATPKERDRIIFLMKTGMNYHDAKREVLSL